MSSLGRAKFKLQGSLNRSSGSDELSTNPLSGKAAQIFDEMETRLMSGYYKFGDPVSIVELAAEFESSRQPVTVAINHLRSLGYLIILPQVGCRVTSPSTQEITDLFYMLSKVESAIAGMAAERHTEPETELLAEIADHIEAIDHKSPDHNLEYAQSVDAFHEAIRVMAHSKIVASKEVTLWRLANFMMWQGVTELKPSQIKEANKERRKILNAIRRGNRTLVESQMEKHILAKPRRVGLA